LQIKLDKTFCSQCSSNYGGDVCDKCADNAFFDSITETCVRCACKIDGVLNTTNICDQVKGILKYFDLLVLFTFLN